ncbi:MAG TPA: acetylxylan esterase, partial [Solirubrobacterales bacterium]|nr:acetylxylan esterase [Solirubrobacterales bacterium]
MKGLTMRGALVAVMASLGALSLPSIAQAQITEVFTDTETPVACEEQTGEDAGIRYCSNFEDPRSTVATWDGVPIDVNVALPPAETYGEGPYPVMMLFHGYAGSKLGLGSMRRWLNQGYATFSMTTRGNHQSCGVQAARDAGGAACDDGYVRLMDTRYEVRDTQELVALLVDEGLIDPDKIGATGGSYGGGMSMALAALKNRKMLPDGSLVAWESPDGTPLRIAGAAPDIPWTDLSYALVPNGGNLDYIADAPYLGHVDRVGIEKQQYVTALYGTGLANGFYAPEGENPDADLTGWKAALDTGGPYGSDVLEIVDEISTHHSSYGIDDSIKPSPLLISSGATDDLFPANEGSRFYNRTLTNHPNADIAFTFADFVHPRGQGLPETGAFITERKDEWLAHYVLG